MRRVLTAAASAACAFVSMPSAQAGTNWPWCAVMGDVEGQAVNCGFASLEQCRSYLDGMGGYCERNPFYQPRPATRPR